MRRRLSTGLLAVLSFAGTSLAAQAPRDVSGRVLAADSTTPLARIVVRSLATGDSALTGRDGRFRLAGLPRAPLRLAVRGPGILPDTVALAADRDTVTIITRPLPIALPAVVIRDRAGGVARERFEEAAQVSTTTLSAAEIRGVPSLLEADVLRAVQLLPGTVAKNDYTISYNVRGGEADQNLVRLDGIPLFNPSHLGGLFSTFDADAVGRTDFYTGGFPAWYPGRLSSVLDVDLRAGNEREMEGRAQVSLLSSKLLVEGPLGGATYLVGARRTYADAVVGLLTDDVLPYYFTDALGKVTVPLGSTQLSVTGYWGRDALDLDLVQEADEQEGVRLAFNWGNSLLGATWLVPVGAGQFETRVGISTFSTTLGLLPSLARFDNRARLLTGQATLIPAPDGVHDLRVGVAVEAYDMTYAAGSPALETSLFEARYRPTVLAAFLDDQWRPFGSLIVRPGVRLEYVTGAGKTLLSPRLSTKFFLDSRTALLGSAGRYHQAVHSIRDQELPVTIFEFWIGANRYIPVARAEHLVFGIERWFGDAVQLSLEGYHKAFGDLVTPNRAQDLSVEGDEYIPARGTSWGVDLLLRKHAGPLRGWIAYGFTRTRREAAGVAYPPAHDRRHTLNVIALVPGPMGSDLGVRWGFGSPLPYTGFAGEWDHRRYDATNHLFDDVDREPIGASINAERYPSYSRLDVSVRWDVRGLGMRWEPYLQVANVYNRRNVFLYFFDYGDVPPTRTGVSQLPLVPTFGVEVTF